MYWFFYKHSKGKCQRVMIPGNSNSIKLLNKHFYCSYLYEIGTVLSERLIVL